MKKICIVTGGTGGHIYPALALASKVKQMHPDTEILFIGNDDRMEADLIPANGYPFFALHTSGLAGSAADRLKAVMQTLACVGKAKAELKRFGADLVIGFGGYVSAPVMMAAQAMKIPTVIHEQNSIVGKSNKLVMNKADAIVTCYDKCDEVFPKEKIRKLGNPRATIAAEAVVDEGYFHSLGLKDGKKTILVMMGSLGSSSVNELMKDALADLDPRLQILYVCGKDNSQDLDLFKGQKNIHVVPYVDTLKIYGRIDGLICRAGATTIAELTALGIPAILIPSPYVANNHQYYNARMLVDCQAAFMIEEKDLNARTLSQAIASLFEQPETMESVRRNALALGKGNAAYDLVELTDALMERRKRP